MNKINREFGRFNVWMDAFNISSYSIEVVYSLSRVPRKCTFASVCAHVHLLQSTCTLSWNKVCTCKHAINANSRNTIQHANVWQWPPFVGTAVGVRIGDAVSNMETTEGIEPISITCVRPTAEDSTIFVHDLTY